MAPDLARKLPGRGLWVAADRASVETAVKKGLFARAAKAPLKPAADLADMVESLLVRRCLDRWALPGATACLSPASRRSPPPIASGKAAWLIEAADGAADGRRKLLALAQHQSAAARSLRRCSRGRIGFGPWAGKCDTHRLPCGAGGPIVGPSRSSDWRDFVRFLPGSWREEPAETPDKDLDGRGSAP